MTVNAQPGEYVGDWLERAIRVANQRRHPVRGTFNGISMQFSPGDTLSQAGEIYDLKTKIARFEAKGY